jgi:hypothetical protein
VAELVLVQEKNVGHQQVHVRVITSVLVISVMQMLNVVVQNVVLAIAVQMQHIFVAKQWVQHKLVVYRQQKVVAVLMVVLRLVRNRNRITHIL